MFLKLLFDIHFRHGNYTLHGTTNSTLPETDGIYTSTSDLRSDNLEPALTQSSPIYFINFSHDYGGRNTILQPEDYELPDYLRLENLIKHPSSTYSCDNDHYPENYKEQEKIKSNDRDSSQDTCEPQEKSKLNCFVKSISGEYKSQISFSNSLYDYIVDIDPDVIENRLHIGEDEVLIEENEDVYWSINTIPDTPPATQDCQPSSSVTENTPSSPFRINTLHRLNSNVLRKNPLSTIFERSDVESRVNTTCTSNLLSKGVCHTCNRNLHESLLPRARRTFTDITQVDDHIYDNNISPEQFAKESVITSYDEDTSYEALDVSHNNQLGGKVVIDDDEDTYENLILSSVKTFQDTIEDKTETKEIHCSNCEKLSAAEKEPVNTKERNQSNKENGDIHPANDHDIAWHGHLGEQVTLTLSHEFINTLNSETPGITEILYEEALKAIGEEGDEILDCDNELYQHLVTDGIIQRGLSVTDNNFLDSPHPYMDIAATKTFRPFFNLNTQLSITSQTEYLTVVSPDPGYQSLLNNQTKFKFQKSISLTSCNSNIYENLKLYMTDNECSEEIMNTLKRSSFILQEVHKAEDNIPTICRSISESKSGFYESLDLTMSENDFKRMETSEEYNSHVKHTISNGPVPDGDDELEEDDDYESFDI